MEDKILRITTIILLIILGLTAILGGWGLIDDPSGKNISFPPGMLENTPFHSYLIPGIILFSLVGVLSLITAVLVFYKIKNHAWLVILEGAILVGWLTAEIFMGFFLALMHLPYYTIAILLIIIGFLLKNKVSEKIKTKIL